LQEPFRYRNDYLPPGFSSTLFATRLNLPCYVNSRAWRTQKINLRRPDIMEEVQAKVLSHYRSELVEQIPRQRRFAFAGELTVKTRQGIGFCYGVGARD